MMQNWEKVKLGTLLTESKIPAQVPNSTKRLRVRLNVQGVDRRPDIDEKVGATKYYTRRAGQFIFGRQNFHKGAFGIVPLELDGFESSSDLPAFDVHDSCFPEWIFYYFKGNKFYLQLEALTKGIGSKRVSLDKLFDLYVPVPTKIEQSRIIDLILQIEERYAQLSVELASQEQNTNNLYTSIFQDAIQGKLTGEWRERHGSEEYADNLIRQIKSSRNLLNDRNQAKNVARSNILNQDGPFELPEKWSWYRLDDLIIDKPRNGYSPSSVDYVTDTKSLKLSATTKGIFDPSEFKYLAQHIPSDSHLWLRDGDILIQRSNSLEYVGVSAIYRGADHEFIYPDLMMKVRAADPDVTEYLYIVLSSPFCREYFRSKATGTSGSMPKINQEVVQNLLVPLPPKPEIFVIIEKSFSLLQLLEETKIRLMQSRTDADSMLYSSIGDLMGSAKGSTSVTDQIAVPQRNEKYGRYQVSNYMEIVELLQLNGKMHSQDLWKMSKYAEDIDSFYAELKVKIEIEGVIREVADEKGYLELA